MVARSEAFILNKDERLLRQEQMDLISNRGKSGADLTVCLVKEKDSLNGSAVINEIFIIVFILFMFYCM